MSGKAMQAPSKRTYKDSLFVDLFCRDRDGKRNFLSLYNALHGTDLRLSDTALKDVSISDVLFSVQNNDVSMLVENRVVVLCEHQSTINENMPLRCLLYLARIYEQQLDAKLRFRRRLQQIPAPEFHVFYNGREPLPASRELHLRDAFAAACGAESAPVDLCVTVHNLNKPTGTARWEQCKPLTEYNDFVKIIQSEQAQGKGYMARAVRRALKSGVLVDYLRRKGTEVENMFFGEYDYATDVAVQREEAWEIGVAEGEHRAKLETARNLLASGIALPEQIASLVGLPVQDVLQLASGAEA